MDQILKVFAIDWKILIVQIVNFSVLLGVLWYLLYKPFTRLIEGRRSQIIQGVADAERAAAALKDADAKKADILAQASLQADALMMAAREAGKKKEADITAEAQARYERTLAEAKLKSEEIQREALEKSKEDIARLIVLGAAKTLESGPATS